MTDPEPVLQPSGGARPPENAPGDLAFTTVKYMVASGPTAVVAGSEAESRLLAVHAVRARCDDLGWAPPTVADLEIEGSAPDGQGGTNYRVASHDRALTATVHVPAEAPGASIAVTLSKIDEQDAWNDDGFAWDA
ncbi:hypothetical protein AB0I28_28600 [Phytomonospora sp. NPDC050363]|uniref:hypothetical protein n=1 Tax=Phytomonospora sp. NPDC050363 TaxID=3155642 RepID=UPI0033E45494